MSRHVVVELWTGAKVVRRLRFGEVDQVLHVEQMSDEAIRANLKRLGVEPLPATEQERQLRLATWPTPSDLDAIATSWIPWNDGVRPTVRTVEKAITWVGAAAA